jgi:hypothetical protein
MLFIKIWLVVLAKKHPKRNLQKRNSFGVNNNFTSSAAGAGGEILCVSPGGFGYK